MSKSGFALYTIAKHSTVEFSVTVPYGPSILFQRLVKKKFPESSCEYRATICCDENNCRTDRDYNVTVRRKDAWRFRLFWLLFKYPFIRNRMSVY